MISPECPCGAADHWSRRTLLKAAGLSGIAWLTPLADRLALAAEARSVGQARSVILLWLAGGASQLDTFDPHPDSPVAQGAKAIDTSVKGIRLSENLPQTAEILDEVTLVRSVVSQEGDHERATYAIKTGYRPSPTIVHPSIGAVVCHELHDPGIDIPTHVSILTGRWPARGGHFGAKYDAFQIWDPVNDIPDVRARVPEEREARRRAGLDAVEKAFARGRDPKLEADRTLHLTNMAEARRMMTSEQIAAFNVADLPESDRAPYGDTPFGRGCLAARQLIEAGVRCVEVTLTGWDSHANNLETQQRQCAVLDAAYASLIRDLRRRGLLESTVVICGTEFGRTPKVNGIDGRDHWPHGFSIALAGGGFRRGHVVGETDPHGEKEPADKVPVEDIHATVQHALGIDPATEYTAGQRPVILSDGRVRENLLL